MVYNKQANAQFSPCLGCKQEAYHRTGYCKKCRDKQKEAEKAKAKARKAGYD